VFAGTTTQFRGKQTSAPKFTFSFGNARSTRGVGVGKDMDMEATKNEINSATQKKQKGNPSFPCWHFERAQKKSASFAKVT